MVTQLQIAQRCGLDVSTVNKILNRHPGSVFRKETVRKVLGVARRMNFDFGRIKHVHRRQDSRRPVSLPLELSIYSAEGQLLDRGSATMSEVSLSGAVLSGIVLLRHSIPLVPHTLGIRILEGPLKDFEIKGQPVRFRRAGETIDLAIAFLRTESAKIGSIRQIV